MGLLEELKTRVLTADGAIGTLLYSYGLDYCHEEMIEVDRYLFEIVSDDKRRIKEVKMTIKDA